MALTEEQLQRLPKKAQDFWRRAFEFVRQNQTEWFLVAKDSAQHKAWAGYFRSRGWEPFAMKQLQSGACHTITMPAEWPEWFEKTGPRLIGEAAE